VHRLLDLHAFLLAAGADLEVHLPYLLGMLSLLTASGRYIEEWVRVFYATVWIDPDHQWMRFRFEREDVTLHAARFASSLDFQSHRLGSTVCAMAPQILLVALTTELHLLQLMSRPCSDLLSQMGRDALQLTSLLQQSTYMS
jgi:hypothetical protein